MTLGKDNTKPKGPDPQKAQNFVKNWWWLIGPALKFGWEQIQKIDFKKIFTKKKGKKDGLTT